MTLATIILAAGQGTRMDSDLPKVLHMLGGVPMLAHATDAALQAGAERRIVVVGHGGEQVSAALADIDPGAEVVWQHQPQGTGHAVLQAGAVLRGHAGPVIVLYGDTPGIRPETIEHLAEALASGVDMAVLGFHTPAPGGYGRLITDEGGGLLRIVEDHEASDEEKRITLCNSGVLACRAELLFDLLPQVRNDNRKSEYYLTDIVGLARDRGLACVAVQCDLSEALGVNTRAELAQAEDAFQNRARREAQENGVTLLAPDTVFLSLTTNLGRDVVVEQNVVFGPDVTVENGARIRAFSHLEGCHVSEGAIIGPFARLRPGAEIGAEVRIGNFVEIKAAQIAQGAKINHLAYVGDATVGERANIGAGTIFCNYDGVFKHHSHVGAGAFIGSNSALVSPVRIGDGAVIGSGSVITTDVPAGDLALSRARQVTKPGLGRRLMDRLRAAKAARSGK